MYNNFTTDSVYCPVINTKFVKSQLDQSLPVGFKNIINRKVYSTFDLDPKLIIFESPINFVIKVTALGGYILYQDV